MEFTLHHSELPQNKILRREMLDDYFPSGLIPFEQKEGAAWKVHVFTPDQASFYVDPSINETIIHWPDPVSIELLGNYWKIVDNSMLSFNDSWSAFYWSLLLSWMESTQSLSKKICLLHIDDHLDLQSPHLIVEKQGYKSVFSSLKVDFRKPQSIKEAIEEKSIGIDGFIAPLLHTLGSLDMLHLRYAYKAPSKSHSLHCKYVEDTLLAKGEKRMAIEHNSTAGSHLYTVSNSLDDIINKAKEYEMILLHIDCDAFSNRFNLDSSWNPQKVSIDLSLGKIKLCIDQLFEELSQLESKVFLNVALSPGFFPSEYWEEISRYIFETARTCGILKKDAFADYLERFSQEAFCG